jgi:hypothetical protein
MSVPLKTAGSGLEFGTPEALFPLPAIFAGPYSYDVSADRQRFLVLAQPAQAETEPLHVIVNWQAALEP